MKLNFDLSTSNWKQVCFFIIFLFFILHLAYIDSYFVNFEWVYRFGSQYFLTNEKFYLEKYFDYQANPLTYSYLTSLIVKFTGIDQYFIYRIPALFGGILLLVTLSGYKNPWLILIVGLNPLIWIYSGRAYSELLSIGLLVLAFKVRKNYVDSLAVTFSAMIKFHSLPFLIIHNVLRWIVLNLEKKNLDFRKPELKSIFLQLTLFLIFLLLYYKYFGIWIVPDNFKDRHASANITALVNNFFSYGFYLSGMFFLTVPAFLRVEKVKFKLFLLVLSVLLAINNKNLGEMDFGSFQQLLGSELILLIKIIGFWNFLLCCQAFWKDEESRILLLTILGYMILLSLSFPANRYLIFVVPFWAILVSQHIPLSRLFWWGYISALAGLNLFATLYQVSNATASANMADWAIQNDVRINLGGILHSHVGDFSHYDPNSPLVVSLAGAQVGKILHEESVHVLGLKIRSYVLTNTNSN